MNFFFFVLVLKALSRLMTDKRGRLLYFQFFMTVSQPHRENFKEGSSRMDEDRAGAASGVGQGDKYVMG